MQKLGKSTKRLRGTSRCHGGDLNTAPAKYRGRMCVNTTLPEHEGGGSTSVPPAGSTCDHATCGMRPVSSAASWNMKLLHRINMFIDIRVINRTSRQHTNRHVETSACILSPGVVCLAFRPSSVLPPPSCNCPAVFFRHRHLTAFLLLKRKLGHRLHKCYHATL